SNNNCYKGIINIIDDINSNNSNVRHYNINYTESFCNKTKSSSGLQEHFHNRANQKIEEYQTQNINKSNDVNKNIDNMCEIVKICFCSIQRSHNSSSSSNGSYNLSSHK
ncbi:hypothetical protein HELRODRAFT_184767, partial [Helobdella robusta]|uniref:Uncharacterized protein n=1 Tax=Helobdella robusta TaxID=6412 RepID=T1FLY3_HELRO